jgi:hypothetical protein
MQHPARGVIIRAVKHRIATVAAALLLATGPGLEQSAETLMTDWRFHRGLALGMQRNLLMSTCALGRSMNSSGISFWGYGFQQRVFQQCVAQWRAKGYRSPWLEEALNAQEAGTAAAMAQVCPDVRELDGWRIGSGAGIGGGGRHPQAAPSQLEGQVRGARSWASGSGWEAWAAGVTDSCRGCH